MGLKIPLRAPSSGKLRVETTVKETGYRKTEAPRTAAREEDIPNTAVLSNVTLGYASFRAGATFAENYQSVTCHVEVMLPFETKPVSADTKAWNDASCQRAIGLAQSIAEETFQREASELKKLLHG